MFKKVLLAFDGLKNTMISANYALYLSKLLNSEIYITYIISSDVLNSVKKCLNKSDKAVKKYCIYRSKGLFNNIKQQSKKINFKNYNINISFSKKVHDGICEQIKKNNIDLVIIQPSPYRNSEAIEDIAAKISRKTKIPTLFIKSKSKLKKHDTLFVPIDEKKQNMVSIDTAIKLAKQIQGKIIFYHSTWPNKKIKSKSAILNCDKTTLENIEKAKQKAKSKNINYELIVEMADTIEGGIIRNAIIKNAELIIMTKSNAFIGGIPNLVLNNSMFPLLVVKK